jgi:hypothetical protein
LRLVRELLARVAMILRLLVGLSLLAAGCSGYRYVERSGNGGTIALEGSRDRARPKAEKAMEDHCPSGYRVLAEGEEMVPPEHYDNDDSENHLSVGESGESLRSGYKNEYRLTYVCDVVTAPPATTSQAPAP